MEDRGWDQVDFVYVTGDAYVDHSSFGTAIISRLLESRGYKVGIIPQPDWRRKESIAIFGEPRLGFLVSAGNMDSMVNHYTVAKKHRQKDSYSPGGKMGLRPDRAVIVYSNLIRQTFKKTPVILGGIEASLRRMAHYDYWENKVKHSILIDSGADLISYGMGEHSIIEIAEALDSGIPVSEITYVAGTVYKCRDLSRTYEPIILPSFDEVQADKQAYARSFAIQYQNTDPFTAGTMAESYGTKGYVIQNPPALPLTQEEMDDVYDLPYAGNYHPMYEKDGGIPALEEIKFSLTSNRGCFGSCSFCALTFHQGRILQTRSHESILKEAVHMTEEKDFKGYIHDVGGPSATFRRPSCQKQLKHGMCKNRACLAPEPCPNLDADHTDYMMLLRKLRAIPGIKKVFIRSGIRFDFLMKDPSGEFFTDLVQHHISGQLKVAPEHCVAHTLDYMGKPHIECYEAFQKRFYEITKSIGKKQYLVPYLMSSHPGSTLQEAVKLSLFLRDNGMHPEQVQDFYPTPSTLSTCMYYTGIHPLTGEKVYVPKNPHEKAIQRALMQYKNPANRELVLEGLKMTGRMDLVGYGPKCLIRPLRENHGGQQHTQGSSRNAKNSRNSKNNKNSSASAKKNTIRNIHKKNSRGGRK